MEARELMKGAWVSFLDKDTYAPTCGQVEGIDGEWCEVSCAIKDTSLRVTYRLKAERLRPIALGREFLARNGFKRVGDYFVIAEKELADVEGSGRLIWTNGRIETLILFNRCEMVVCECKYVHQLQRAMTVFGVEKEVKP